MKYIPLTQGKQALVDDDDYEWLSKYNWQYHMGYAKTGVKTLRMHRVIVKAPPDSEVDHINRDKLDNRKENLRIATRSQNNRNMGRRKDNTSGHKGVNYFKPRDCWVARVQVDGKRYYVGSFKSKDEALMAIEQARTVYAY